MPTNPSAKPTRHPRLASRVVDGEAVLVDPDRNVVRMLNTVGSRIWELADGTRTVDEIARTLTEEFEVEVQEARQSVVQFVDELAGKELLIRFARSLSNMQTKVTRPQSDKPENRKAKWEAPRIEIEYSLVARAQNPRDDALDFHFVGPLAGC